MITEMQKHFTAYDDARVKLLILKGKGRAFCGGGDVVAVVQYFRERFQYKNGCSTDVANFFWNGYILNYLIATYSKPQVSLLDGIVMGGGAGVTIHGRFRVATEKTVFAMPETALGFFPDVGSSYFLSRLPGFLGEYVGLTGARLNGAEMLSCGLATHFVPSEKLTALEDSLTEVGSSDPFAVCAVIDKYSEQLPLKETSAFNRLDIIDKCFSKKSVEEILSALEQEAVNNTEWILAAVQSLKKASPLSLKISLRLIREGRLRGVGQCLIMDYRICSHIMRDGMSSDFYEGLLLVRDEDC